MSGVGGWLSSRRAGWAPTLLVAALCVVEPARAEVTAMTPGALAHELDRVANTGRVLYVAAHPDDENTRLLAYLSNARHVTAGYLSLTRGEGGQNLIGPEQGELLGIIRTQELLAARRLDGAVQRFTRMRDFGYSKSAKEALSKWGEEEALADVVWAIRRFQPDVVITRFNEQPPNHGHHTASAILARRAVEAAADPKRFPEQLREGATPWTVQRLLYNVSPWREKAPADALKLDVGGYDVRLGLSYGELAALSRSEHKSQGFGSLGERGELLEHFTHVAGTRAKQDLLEGLDLTWMRFGPKAEPLVRALNEARATLARDEPEKALPALMAAHRALDALSDGPRTREAREDLEAVAQAAAGLFVRATAPSAAAVPGSVLPVQVELVKRRPSDLQVRSIRVTSGAAVEVKAPLGINEKKEISTEVKVPSDAQVSSPYWLRAVPGGGRDAVEDRALIGRPESPPPIRVEVALTVAGRAFSTEVPVVHVWKDRVHGERTQRVLILPPATVTPVRRAVMLPNGRAGRVSVRVRGWKEGVEGTVQLPLPKGWTVQPATHAVKLARLGDEVTVHFDVKGPRGAAPITAAPEVVVGDKAWSHREDVIDYPHIPVQVVVQDAALRLVPVSVQLPKGLIGYVEGSGDTVAEDLAHLGVSVQAVDEATLRSGNLQRFSAIVLGIRAFNTRPMLQGVLPRLNDYVAKGGTVVVQYNTHSRFSPFEGELGPYPLTLGPSRVTDETARITPIAPGHPVLTTPNRLGPSDYEGWVQERGLYFGEKWDPRYTPVLRMADPGEEPLDGSLLVARHGKGRYVYTGLSFFRQLPAGVPGAYRLLINLVGGR